MELSNTYRMRMLEIKDTLAGDEITFYCLETTADYAQYKDFVAGHRWLALDTESTGLNCYIPQWRLRTFQCGDKYISYVVPARFKHLIDWTMRQSFVNWIGHNGPHDIRCIDAYLGYETGVVCAGETYIPAHHLDSRSAREGGIDHGLKEQAIGRIDRAAGKWEVELKKVFKTITIPIPGEVYKSGPSKGMPKVRKAKLSEGWSLIDPRNPAYIAYAAADPILTYRLWVALQQTLRENTKLYRFDHKVQRACDRLQRRGLPLDVPYTKRLSKAFTQKSNEMMDIAAEYGCNNIQSGQQIAATLIELGADLRARTPTGQYKTDDNILRNLVRGSNDRHIRRFIQAVLVAKQLIKRRENYTEAFLRELDGSGRVHASINSLGARTARMSVSKPALQQLPTKDREAELGED